MPLFPEKESIATPEAASVRQEVPEIPETLKQAGVTTPQAQFSAQVTDDTGQSLITPTTATLQIPSDTATLTALAKGNIAAAITWFATFWLRTIKKAIHFGWKIVSK